MPFTQVNSLLGKVEEYLNTYLSQNGAGHIALLDPVDIDPRTAVTVATACERAGSCALMVGGSTVADPMTMSHVIREVKSHAKIPVIVFPNNIASIVPEADAIWFMSLLNSRNPYYITGAQMLGAPIVRAYGVEPLPMAYIIVGHGAAAGFVGDANPIPIDKPELAAAYALAAAYLGMRFVYLEAGSGAEKPIPPTFVKVVKKALPENVKLIVGGGIREPDQAGELVAAGADLIVTGTVLEESKSFSKLNKIISKIIEVGRLRIQT